MSVALYVLATACLIGAVGLGLAALFTRDVAVAWRRVADATAGALPAGPADVAAAAKRGDARLVRLRGRAVGAPDGAPLLAPRSRQPCAWYSAWATEGNRRPDGSRLGGHVAVFERSDAPVCVAAGEQAVVLDPATLWVQPADGRDDGIPFGAAPAHRALSAWPRIRSWAAWEAEAPSLTRDLVSFGEVRLDPGAEVDVYGIPAQTPDGRPTLRPAPGGEGVVALLRGGDVAERAAVQAQAVGRRRRVRARAAAASAVAFVVLAAVSGAIAS